MKVEGIIVIRKELDPNKFLSKFDFFKDEKIKIQISENQHLAWRIRNQEIGSLINFEGQSNPSEIEELRIALQGKNEIIKYVIY